MADIDEYRYHQISENRISKAGESLFPGSFAIVPCDHVAHDVCKFLSMGFVLLGDHYEREGQIR